MMDTTLRSTTVLEESPRAVPPPCDSRARQSQKDRRPRRAGSGARPISFRGPMLREKSTPGNPWNICRPAISARPPGAPCSMASQGKPARRCCGPPRTSSSTAASSTPSTAPWITGRRRQGLASGPQASTTFGSASGANLTGPNFASSWPLPAQLRPSLGELGHFRREFGNLSTNSAKYDAKSTIFRRTRPILARFRPTFGDVGRYWREFGILPAIAPNSAYSGSKSAKCCRVRLIY